MGFSQNVSLAQFMTRTSSPQIPTHCDSNGCSLGIVSNYRSWLGSCRDLFKKIEDLQIKTLSILALNPEP